MSLLILISGTTEIILKHVERNENSNNSETSIKMEKAKEDKNHRSTEPQAGKVRITVCTAQSCESRRDQKRFLTSSLILAGTEANSGDRA